MTLRTPRSGTHSIVLLSDCNQQSRSVIVRISQSRSQSIGAEHAALLLVDAGFHKEPYCYYNIMFLRIRPNIAMKFTLTTLTIAFYSKIYRFRQYVLIVYAKMMAPTPSNKYIVRALMTYTGTEKNGTVSKL